MLRSGKLSVWAGNIHSEEALLTYVDDGAFGSDFDFNINPAFGRELKVEQRPVELKCLVQGFSSWNAFGDACVRQGKAIGLEFANAMVVLYAFEYVPSPKISREARLVFLGAFDF